MDGCSKNEFGGRASVFWGIAIALISPMWLPDAHAQDWPQLFGPDRDNTAEESGLARQWPEEGPPLLWKTEGIGAGYSSVAISGDRIVTMGGKQGKEGLLVMNFEDGKLLWGVELGRTFEDSSGSGPRGVPTISDGKAYTLGSLGVVSCVDLESREVVWQRDFVDEYESDVPDHGFRESVLVDGGNVICVPGGREALVVAFNKETGEEVWRTPNDRGSHRAEYATVAKGTVHGVPQYAVFTSRGLLGIRASDGEVLWEDDTISSGDSCCTPLVRGNQVFYTNQGREGGVLINIEQNGDEWETSEAWASEDFAVHYGEVVEHQGHLFGFNDTELTCVDFSNGRVKWQERVEHEDGRRFDRHGIITLADGMIVARGYGGGVALLDANPSEFRQLGGFLPENRANRSRAPSEPAYPHPVVCRGRLFLRDQKVLLCYDLRPRS